LWHVAAPCARWWWQENQLLILSPFRRNLFWQGAQ
jgi:hypothetical protein